LLQIGICLGDVYSVIRTIRLEISRRKDESFGQLGIVFVYGD
jgi:hypothetical protein